MLQLATFAASLTFSKQRYKVAISAPINLLNPLTASLFAYIQCRRSLSSRRLQQVKIFTVEIDRATTHRKVEG